MNNYKTVLCKYLPNCQRGDRCTFAHSNDELHSSPCWFFNNGGCNKPADACPHRHILVDNLRKPLRLQRPCDLVHLSSKHICDRDFCTRDHFELTEEEWNHHYKNVACLYPGKGYLAPVLPTPQLYTWQMFDYNENPINLSAIANSAEEASRIIYQRILDYKTFIDSYKDAPYPDWSRLTTQIPNTLFQEGPFVPRIPTLLDDEPYLAKFLMTTTPKVTPLDHGLVIFSSALQG